MLSKFRLKSSRLLLPFRIDYQTFSRKIFKLTLSVVSIAEILRLNRPSLSFYGLALVTYALALSGNQNDQNKPSQRQPH